MPEHLSNPSRTVSADAVCPLCNDGYFRFYTAPMPTTADDPLTTQTLLAECRFANPAFGAAVNGVAVANAMPEDPSADAVGDIAWFRAYRSDGVTVVFDGTVGLIGSGADIEMNRVDCTPGANVALTGFVFTQAR